MTPPRNNIHRQQLFHWIGKGIETHTPRGRRKLTDDQRDQYVSHLRGSIEQGLWMTQTGSERICFGDRGFKQTLPATCFTEWSLYRSAPHTENYGRLGLGFPKQIILLKGGQPVTYFKSTGPEQRYAQGLIDIMKYLETKQKHEPDAAVLLAQFKYLASFARAIKTPLDPPRRSTKPKAKKSAKYKLRKRTAPGKRTSPDPFARKFGRPLDIAEEREWRIVYHPDLLRRRTIVQGPGTPPYFVPYKPGTQLFTVVLPDNRTVGRVLQDKFLKSELFGVRRPHVTVLSFEDIGTF